MGSVLLNIFTKNIDEGIKCTLSKLANNTKLLGVIIYLRGGRLCSRIWIVWIDGLHPNVWHSMSGRRCTCAIVTSCRGKSWGEEWQGSCMVEKELEAMVDSWLNMSQKCSQVGHTTSEDGMSHTSTLGTVILCSLTSQSHLPPSLFCLCNTAEEFDCSDFRPGPSSLKHCSGSQLTQVGVVGHSSCPSGEPW